MSLCNHIKCSGFKIEFISFCGNIESQFLNSPSIAFSILTRLHLKGGGGGGVGEGWWGVLRSKHHSVYSPSTVSL